MNSLQLWLPEEKRANKIRQHSIGQHRLVSVGWGGRRQRERETERQEKLGREKVGGEYIGVPRGVEKWTGNLECIDQDILFTSIKLLKNK